MSESARPTIVLVHGAWHGPWCWDQLRSALHDDGWTTTAPQLPSAAAAVTNQPTAGLRGDIAALCDHLDDIDGPVVLVGHSYGGMPVTEVAALRRSAVTQVVYVAAYLPQLGDSLFSIHGAPAPEDVSGTTAVPDNPIETFYADVPAKIAADAVDKLVPQSVRSWSEKIESIVQGVVPTTYLLCERDQALPPPVQESFAARVDAVVRLDSSHSPFLSQPRKLAGVIGQVMASGKTADMDSERL